MRGLEVLVRSIDALNEMIGRVVAWMTLGTVLVCFTVVVLRYVVGLGLTWIQELYIWQHAIVFLVGAGYTFLHNGHVRVDIFYAKMSVRKKAWVDLFGTIVFLYPWLFVVAWLSRDFILSSWAIREGSNQANGLGGVFFLKTMIWVFCGVVALQGLALMARSILVLTGRPQWAPGQAVH